MCRCETGYHMWERGGGERDGGVEGNAASRERGKSCSETASGQLRLYTPQIGSCFEAGGGGQSAAAAVIAAAAAAVKTEAWDDAKQETDDASADAAVAAVAVVVVAAAAL